MLRIDKSKFVPFYEINSNNGGNNLSRGGEAHIFFYGRIKSITEGSLEMAYYGFLNDEPHINLRGCIDETYNI